MAAVAVRIRDQGDHGGDGVGSDGGGREGGLEDKLTFQLPCWPPRLLQLFSPGQLCRHCAWNIGHW